jgi:exodeoxyribonuclease III
MNHAKSSLIVTLAFCLLNTICVSAAGAAETIRVLTFNIKLDGELGLPAVINFIRHSKADIVGLQESRDNSAKIAEALGFHYVQHGYCALLTRLKIDSTTSGGNGIIVCSDGGKKLAFFTKHMYYKPYQPYQFFGIKFSWCPNESGDKISTEAEAIAEAKKARGADVEDVLKDVASLKDADLPTILCGDFNEPSYLDWTEAATRAGRHPARVAWPATTAISQSGFQDAYRQIYPDEMAHPGNTWTPMTRPDDPQDHHDRIDYIYYRGKGIKLKSVDIIGENAQNATIVFPLPSDHRAVTAEFELTGTDK